MFVCPECGAAQPGPGPCPNDGAPRAPIGDDLLLGQTIGVYRVARLLGIGGMGRVYKGVHPQIGSRVAIKVLSRECSDRRDLVERFFSEAKAVNLIRHESIVNVLDLATLPDGRPYIVMEYLDGAPLSALVDDAVRNGYALPLGGVARLAAEVLDALGAAHAKGIIHRDLKPDNIFVTPQGRAKVLDFGIAKLQPELGGSATHTGSLLGTPHYMSPEQAAGRVVDARADLYAIGVILFECSTGHKPFVADSLFDLLRKHVEAPPPSPRAMRRDMPVEMEQVIHTALAKAPEMRFASAHAMSMALQHATRALPPEAWTPITPPQIGRGPSSTPGWHPTPPASWAGRQRADGAPTQPSTQTAGQVGAPTGARKKSRSGLWVMIAALVLIGGGISVAVIAGGGGGSGSGSSGSGSSASTSGNGSASGDGSTSGNGSASGNANGSGVAVGNGNGSSSGNGNAAGSSSTSGSAVAQTDDNSDSDGDLDADTQAALDDAVAQAIDQMPPEARKFLPPKLTAALKKYGKWSKIPKAERMKLLAEVGGMAGALGAATGNQVNNALAGNPTTTPTPQPQPAVQKPATTSGWVTRHPVTPPNFDPKHVNVDAFITWAIAEGKRNMPDAEVVWIDASGVFPDGHADLTLPTRSGGGGEMTVRFISPSHAKRDPNLPHGVAQELKCSFRIYVQANGGELYDTGCDPKDATLPRPRCSIAQVWKKALARKKDLSNAVAQLVYTSNIVSHKIVWMFDIHDNDESLFSEQFPDDC